MSCKNCKADISDQTNYCPQCGARVAVDRLSVYSLLKDGFESFFSLEEGLLRTVKDVTIVPEKVSLGFISGLRKRYVPPARYLILSLAFYGLYLFFSKYVQGNDAGYFHEEFIKGFFEYDDDLFLSPEEKDGFLDRLRFFAIPFMVLIVPLAALVSKLIFRKKQLNFTEYLVVNAYWLAQLILLLLPLALLGNYFAPEDQNSLTFLGGLMMCLIVVFTFRLLIRTFELKGWRAFLHPTLFLLLTLFFVILLYPSLGYFLI